MSLLVQVDLSVPSSEDLEGANILPLRHWLPKAPWPDLEVPEPPILGIRATARPVPQDSAE